jgi:hypothetical protein
MNDEVKGICLEAVVAQWWYNPGICLEGLRKTTNPSVGTAGVPVLIRKAQLRNTVLPLDQLIRFENHAISQAVSRRIPIAAVRVPSLFWSWFLWWAKWHWGSFSPSTSVSPANSHSTNCFIFIDHPITNAIITVSILTTSFNNKLELLGLKHSK